MDVFRFKLDPKFNKYDKNKLILLAQLKIEDYKKNLNRLQENVAEIQCKNFDILSICKKMQGKSLKFDKDFIDENLSFVIKNLNDVMSLIRVIFKKDSIEFKRNLNSIFYFIDEDKKNNIINIPKIYTSVESFLLSVEGSIKKMIDMFEKLKELEHKPLKILVTINEKNEVETHFIKYSINYEHFGDFLHEILKKDLENVFLKDFIEVLNNYLIVTKHVDFDNINYNSFVRATIALSKLEESLCSFNDIFLEAFPSFKIIKYTREKYHKLIELSAKKTSYFYEKSKEISMDHLFANFLARVRSIKLSQFLNLTDEDFENMILDSSYDDSKGFDFFYFELKYFEIDLYNDLFRNAINNYKNKNNYTNVFFKEKYLTKNAERGLYDNNQFYTNEIEFLKTIEEEVFSQRKYIKTMGTDAVIKGENNFVFRKEYYSKILKKKIYSTIFINSEKYYINLLGNYQEVILAKSEEFAKKFNKAS